MDYSVDKYSLLPAITFGDFSKEEIYEFFRVTKVGAQNQQRAKMADDNPFSLKKHSVSDENILSTDSSEFSTGKSDLDANPFSLKNTVSDEIVVYSKDSSASIAGHVNTLHLSSSQPSVAGPSKQNININCGNQDDGKSKSTGKHDDRSSTSPGSAEDMETEQSSGSVSQPNLAKSSKSNNVFHTPVSSTSKFTVPLSSPSSIKRRTRASARALENNNNGAPISISKSKSSVHSASKEKSEKNEKKKNLKSSVSKLFTLDDHVDLSQLVSTQSENLGLKVVIRKHGTVHTASHVTIGPKQINTNLGQNTGQISVSKLRDPAPVCLQNTSPVAGSPAPLEQRTNRRSSRGQSSSRDKTPANSGHVLSSNSDNSGPSGILSIRDNMPTHTPRTLISNILNKRIASNDEISVSGSDSNHSDIISNHLRKIRETASKNAFSLQPGPSGIQNFPKSSTIISQNLQVTRDENTRTVNFGSDQTQVKVTTSKRHLIKNWGSYKETISHNPFKVISNINPVDPKNPVNQSNTRSNLLQAPIKGVFKGAEAVLNEYTTSLSKEMVTKLHVQQLDSQLEENLYPNWCVTYKPPPTLITNEDKVAKIVQTRERLAREMLRTNLTLYQELLSEHEENSENLVSTLQDIYKTTAAKNYNLNLALDIATSKATKERTKKLNELEKIMTAIRQAPLAALWQGIPEDYDRPDAAIRIANRATRSPNNAPRNNRPQNQNVPRSRPQNRSNTPSANNRDRSSSNKPFNKKRKDQLSRYVENAVNNAINRKLNNM